MPLMIKVSRLLILLISLMIVGCSNSKIENVSVSSVQFDLFEYFRGETKAWGIVVDRFGNFQKSFSVKMVGTVQNDLLILREYFEYNNGEKEFREWSIRKTGSNSFEGVSDNIVGFAEGRELNNTMNFIYKSKIEIGERDITVKFDDWFLRTDKKTVINRAEITKFGFKIAEVSIFFRK